MTNSIRKAFPHCITLSQHTQETVSSDRDVHAPVIDSDIASSLKLHSVVQWWPPRKHRAAIKNERSPVRTKTKMSAESLMRRVKGWLRQRTESRREALLSRMTYRKAVGVWRVCFILCSAESTHSNQNKWEKARTGGLKKWPSVLTLMHKQPKQGLPAWGFFFFQPCKMNSTIIYIVWVSRLMLSVWGLSSGPTQANCGHDGAQIILA